MVDTPFTTFAFPTASGTTPRTMPNRLEDVINVRDFGAVGDGDPSEPGGGTDDTAAIQAAMAAAWGPYSSPHGQAGMYSNKPLFFPCGDYFVSSPAEMTITAIANNGGLVKCTVSPNTTGYLTNYIVNIYGVPGDTLDGHNIGTLGTGSTYAITVDDSTHVTLRASDFAAAPVGFLVGGKICCAALQIRSAFGVEIFGGSREATRIRSETGGIFATNGFAYAHVHDISFRPSNSLRGSGRSICGIDLNWDNTGDSALQSITFDNMNFGYGDYGIRIGAGGHMGSEILSLNCFYSLCAEAGISVWNQNSLMITVIGGNMSANKVGTWARGGVITKIQDVSFQGNIDWDIDQGGSIGSNDILNVINCRTESNNFIRAVHGTGTYVVGCNQTGSGGVFLRANGTMMVDCCGSDTGTIEASSTGFLRGRGNNFTRSDWLGITTQIYAGQAYTDGFQYLRDVPNSSGQLVNATFASLPTAQEKLAGARVHIYDANVTTGLVTTGGGANHVMAICRFATSAWGWYVETLIK
jgi:hypothetical protein